jgi:hypothetical protein
MRQYVRHPTELPVRVTTGTGSPLAGLASRRACNVSAGGLAFLSEKPLPAGSVLQLRIDAVEPAFEAAARVIWCRQRGPGYEAGVEFLDGAAVTRAQMVEQVCRIEMYRRSVFEHEHRELTDEETAYGFVRRFVESVSGAELH